MIKKKHEYNPYTTPQHIACLQSGFVQMLGHHKCDDHLLARMRHAFVPGVRMSAAARSIAMRVEFFRTLFMQSYSHEYFCEGERC